MHMLNKPEEIYFGQIAYKFKVSQGLVDRINAKCETLDDKTNAQGHLVGKIKNEYHFTNHVAEVDTDLEIKDSVYHVVDYCPQDFSYDIEEINMNSAWINDQYENEYQGVHTHSGKEDLGFSSILYLKVPDFGKEITDTGKALNGKTELIGNCGGIWSKPTHLITPKVGDFYIFPYDMQHVVYPFNGNGMRRSLVCNFDIKRNKKYSMKKGKRHEYNK